MKIEIRSDGKATIEGYVNVVARESRMLSNEHGTFVEVVEPRTFAKALEQNSNVGLMFNHKKPLGNQSDGSVELREDNIGLYAKAHVSDEETIEKAKTKKLKGWSFAFVKKADEWRTSEDGVQHRYLKDIELREVSILDVTPAYIGTSIEMRDGNTDLVEFRMQDESIELVDNSTPKVEEPIKEERQVEQDDLSIFYAKKQLEILKLKGGQTHES